TAEKTGLARALSETFAPWSNPIARHDPGKIVLDLAVALALGGDWLADLAQLRGDPEFFGSVASDPTVSRLVAALAADAPTALSAINAARAAARERCEGAPHTGPIGRSPPDRPSPADSPADREEAHSPPGYR